MTEHRKPRQGAPRTTLVALRFLMEWTQADVAERAGVGQTVICRIERGQHDLAMSATEERVARGYGLTVVQFKRLCDGALLPERALSLARKACKAAAIEAG